jgi:hypothetical protein
MAAGDGREWLVNDPTGNADEPSWNLQQALQEWVDKCQQLSAAINEHAACAYRKSYLAVRRSSRRKDCSTLRGPRSIRAA